MFWKIFFYHLFDMAIYQVKDKFIELGKLLGCDGNYIIKYGIDTQGTFKLVFFNGKAVAYNLYNDVPAEFFDKETDMLRSNTKMQISLAKMGNQDDMLMFFCVGDGCYLFTKIYRISADDIKFISTVCGQEYMFVDYSLTVPYGSQGLYETYLYCDREILHVVE